MNAAEITEDVIIEAETASDAEVMKAALIMLIDHENTLNLLKRTLSKMSCLRWNSTGTTFLEMARCEGNASCLSLRWCIHSSAQKWGRRREVCQHLTVLP